MSVEAPCVAVTRRLAGEAIRALRASGLLRGDLKVEARSGEVLIPVTEASQALKVLEEKGIESRSCRGGFRVRGVKNKPSLPPGGSG